MRSAAERRMRLRPALGLAAAWLAGWAIAAAPTTQLMVEVRGEDSLLPIVGASVLVRSEAGEVLGEGRTNKHGVAVIDGVPLALVRLQVLASIEWNARGLQVDVAALEAPPTVLVALKRTPAPAAP
jgi:hypothetical protein